jgi:hypothetical protein
MIINAWGGRYFTYKEIEIKVTLDFTSNIGICNAIEQFCHNLEAIDGQHGILYPDKPCISFYHHQLGSLNQQKFILLVMEIMFGLTVRTAMLGPDPLPPCRWLIRKSPLNPKD